MKTSTPSLLMIAFATINAFIAINMEGDAGHGMEEELGEYAVHLYHMSAKYHMWHVFGLIGLGILYDLWTDRWSRLCLGFAGLSFAAGIILFCGGTYYIPYGGTITPVVIGAQMFLIGWAAFFIATITRKPSTKAK